MSNTPYNSKNTTSSNHIGETFGFRSIDQQDKQPLVNAVFHSVANRYDLMNDIMSLGVHRHWKNQMIDWLSPPANPNWHSLDVAGGTGDIAFRIVKAGKHKVKTTVLDINASMLEVGKNRANTKKLDHCLNFVEANAESLPFPDNVFNAYTIAFGIRNVPDISKALSEAYRVLKPGGRFLCLEFSQIQMPFLDKFYDLWSFHAIPKIGNMITGDAESYQYLVESIRQFPHQKDFAKLIEEAKFSHVKWRSLSGGIVAIHSGWKI